MRKIVYLFFVLCCVLLITEIGLQIVHLVIHYGEKKEFIDERFALPHYKDKEWAKELDKELSELSGDYKEYRGWGKKEYHGKYLNIDRNGIRKTWSPPDLNSEAAKTLYVFGPSSIWGVGVRDDHTVPSYISKELHKKNYKFKVSNYGEWSYTFTQGLIYLILQLRDGHRPDYVAFFDGIDTYNSYQSGVAGTLHFSFAFREKGEKQTDFQLISTGISNVITKNSMIYRELSKIRRKLNPPKTQFTEVGHAFNDDQLSKLSEDVVEYLFESVALLDNLSKIYGFEYIFFWPPSLLTENRLLDEEINLDIRLKDKSLVKLYRLTDDLLKTGRAPHFYNIADTFSERTKTYYLDFGHTSEEGNELIAKRMVSIFENEYLLEGATDK